MAKLDTPLSRRKVFEGWISKGFSNRETAAIMKYIKSREISADLPQIYKDKIFQIEGWDKD